MTSLPFTSELTTVTVGPITLKLWMLQDLDEALEHYSMVAPSDSDMIPYYTLLWDSARALAEFLVDHPDLVQGKHVLELGCGLALPALVAAKLGGTVTASDYHPDNEPFFRRNAALNGLTRIDYQRLDWRNPNLPRTFDLVLGSDLIYERDMVPHLVDCVRRFCAPGSTFILADPGRSALQDTVTRLEQAGFTCDTEAADEIFLIVAGAPRG